MIYNLLGLFLKHHKLVCYRYDILVSQNYNEHDTTFKKLNFSWNVDLSTTYDTSDFGVEQIKENKEIWNNVLEGRDYFYHVQRTPDTNYHHYYRLTSWDLLLFDENFTLTYDICKYLKSEKVLIGGDYILEDGHFMTKDVQTHEINGLVLFQHKEVLNDIELNHIMEDKEMVDFIFENHFHTEYYSCKCWRINDKRVKHYSYLPQGTGLIDRIIIAFFENFSYNDFKTIVSDITK